MLGKIEGGRTRGGQRMRRPDGITNSMGCLRLWITIEIYHWAVQSTHSPITIFGTSNCAKYSNKTTYKLLERNE